MNGNNLFPIESDMLFAHDIAIKEYYDALSKTAFAIKEGQKPQPDSGQKNAEFVDELLKKQ